MSQSIKNDSANQPPGLSRRSAAPTKGRPLPDAMPEGNPVPWSSLPYLFPTFLLVLAVVCPLLAPALFPRTGPASIPDPAPNSAGLADMSQELTALKTEMKASLAALGKKVDGNNSPAPSLSDEQLKQIAAAAEAVKGIKASLPILENYDDFQNKIRGQLNGIRNAIEQLKKDPTPVDTLVIALHSDAGLNLRNYVEPLRDLFTEQTFRSLYKNYRLGLYAYTLGTETAFVPLTADPHDVKLDNLNRIGDPSMGSTDSLDEVGARLSALFQGSKGQRRVVLVVSAGTPPPTPEKRGVFKDLAVDAILIGPAEEQKNIPGWLAFCSHQHGALVWLHSKRNAPDAQQLAELKYHLRRLVHPQLVRN